MKKTIALIALLIAANSSFSQQTNASAPLTKKDYLQKSKKQKTAAWILMGAGLGVTILGLTSENDPSDNNSGNSGRTVGIITGVSAISVSTALFIAATNNRNKAQSLGFKMEKGQFIRQGGLVYQPFPAVSLRLKL
jgi:hypothetical protein